MLSQQLEAQNRGVNVICPKCGAVGVVLWEDENNEGRSLVSLSKNFYERISKKQPYPIELVCHSCGTAQSENGPEGSTPTRSRNHCNSKLLVAHFFDLLCPGCVVEGAVR